MALSTIRRITDEDTERMEAAARRFVDRHRDEFLSLHRCHPDDNESRAQWVEDALAPGYGESEWDESTRKYLARLWLAAFRRAVREPGADTYGYGYIGNHVD